MEALSLAHPSLEGVHSQGSSCSRCTAELVAESSRIDRSNLRMLQEESAGRFGCSQGVDSQGRQPLLAEQPESKVGLL